MRAMECAVAKVSAHVMVKVTMHTVVVVMATVHALDTLYIECNR